mmetsp:Transcript_30672/g.44013  ORF Transcript_30672/g.44013 Transcript_30672/m.44013 type:complete len:339 (+) Transcript_30672:1-1017(+)
MKLRKEDSMTLPSCFLIKANTPAALRQASDLLNTRIATVICWDLNDPPIPSTERAEPAARPSILPLVPTKRHVFVDNSNVFIGAKQQGSTFNNNARIDIRKLATLLVGHSTSPGTKIVAGSKPPINGGVWNIWAKADFQVKVISRDSDTKKEDTVDDFLHAQILVATAKSRIAHDPVGTNTLVLATGDGNANGGYCTFVDVVNDALNSGWRVEIWSWRKSLSNNLLMLYNANKDRMSVEYLDDKDVNRAYTKVSSTEAHKDESNANTKMGATALMPSTAVVEDDDDDYDECVVCVERCSIYAIVPCGHLCLCDVCLPKVTICPLCYGPKESSLRVYSY